MKRGLCFLMLLTAGCGLTQELEPSEPLCEPKDPKERVGDPARIWGFFQECFQCEHWAWAHKVLSRETKERLPYEAFYPAFASYRILRGLITESEQHGEPVDAEDGKSKVVRICNTAYGFSEEIELHSQFRGRLWGIHIPPEQQERFRKAAFDYWDHQYEAAGDFFVYTRDMRPPKVWAACPCGKADP